MSFLECVVQLKQHTDLIALWCKPDLGHYSSTLRRFLNRYRICRAKFPHRNWSIRWTSQIYMYTRQTLNTTLYHPTHQLRRISWDGKEIKYLINLNIDLRPLPSFANTRYMEMQYLINITITINMGSQAIHGLFWTRILK